MNLKGKISKVAICKRCKEQVLAAHIDYIDKSREKEFTELTNEGFLVKVETANQTRKRAMGSYTDCIAKLCEKRVATKRAGKHVEGKVIQ